MNVDLYLLKWNLLRESIKKDSYFLSVFSVSVHPFVKIFLGLNTLTRYFVVSKCPNDNSSQIHIDDEIPTSSMQILYDL